MSSDGNGSSFQRIKCLHLLSIDKNNDSETLEKNTLFHFLLTDILNTLMLQDRWDACGKINDSW